MYKFLEWLEKERGEYASILAIFILVLIGVPAISILIVWIFYITSGWILLALLIAPAWVAWMFYCYITRERDQ